MKEGYYVTLKQAEIHIYLKTTHTDKKFSKYYSMNFCQKLPHDNVYIYVINVEIFFTNKFEILSLIVAQRSGFHVSQTVFSHTVVFASEYSSGRK